MIDLTYHKSSMWSSWYDRGYPLLGKPGSLHKHLFHILYKYLQSRKRMKVRILHSSYKTAPGHWFVTLGILLSGSKSRSSSLLIDSSTQDSSKWLEWNKCMETNPNKRAEGKPLLVIQCMGTEIVQRHNSKGGRCSERGQQIQTLSGNNSNCPRNNVARPSQLSALPYHIQLSLVKPFSPKTERPLSAPCSEATSRMLVYGGKQCAWGKRVCRPHLVIV